MTWKVKGDDERANWTFTPFENVGPLAFGMTPDEVVAALDGAKVNSARRSHTSEHGAFVPGWSRFLPLGVTTYFYGRPERLGLIAVDALDGVQVTWEDVKLVGRLPSELTDWFCERVAQSENMAECDAWGDLYADDFGVGIRAQRAGWDTLRTRPVFAGRAVSRRLAHNQEGLIPDVEFQVH